MFQLTKTSVLDMVERAIRTWVGFFLTTMIASGATDADTSVASITDWSILTKAALSGVGAVVTIVIAFLFGVFGPKNGTTSLVPDVIDAEVVRALDPAGVAPPPHPVDV